MKKTRPLLASLALVPAASLILAGCGSTGNADAGSNGDAGSGKLTVVASTNVYGDIARTIGGGHVEVTEIINSAAQDPHSYEASAKDKLAISKASLLLANGGGFDSFMDTMYDSLPADGAKDIKLLHAVDFSPVPGEQEAAEHEHEQEEEGHEHEGHEHAEYNEHVWYDLDSMEQLAPELASQLGELDPEAADDFDANAKNFVAELGKLREQLKSTGLEGKGFVMTEPLPLHLLEDAGLHDETPEGLSEAIEEGEEITPLSLKQAQDILESGDVALLAYNTQTEGAETKKIRDSAEQGGVPVEDFTETITDGSSYLEWMKHNIDSIASAAK